MPFKSVAAAASYCRQLYQFYAIDFASSAAAKLEMSAAKALLFRDFLTSLADSNGTAPEASEGTRRLLHRQQMERH